MNKDINGWEDYTIDDIGELDGLKIFVSPKKFEEIKKQKIIQENKILKEQQNKIDKYEEVLDKIKEELKKHIRKDGFLELNEWQTRDILELLEEIE